MQLIQKGVKHEKKKKGEKEQMEQTDKKSKIVDLKTTIC